MFAIVYSLSQLLHLRSMCLWGNGFHSAYKLSTSSSQKGSLTAITMFELAVSVFTKVHWGVPALPVIKTSSFIESRPSRCFKFQVTFDSAQSIYLRDFTTDFHITPFLGNVTARIHPYNNSIRVKRLFFLKTNMVTCLKKNLIII